MSATGAARKPVESAGVGRDVQRNNELMREMGSTKGYDPIPPDQYTTYQDRRYPPALRLWAWLLAHTIRQGSRSPYAVDDRGRPLTLEHARADLTIDDKPMDAGNIRRAWRELEEEKRVHRDRHGALCVRGDVTLPAVREGEEKATEVCTDLFAPYLRKQIEKLPPLKREELLAQYTAEHKAQKAMLADAAFAVRLIYDQRKDSILSRFGVKQIREEHKLQQKLPLAGAEEDQRGALRQQLADVVSAAVERSVQTFSASVQTRNGGCTNPPTASVQTAPSLLSSEVTETEKDSRSSSSVPKPAAVETTTNGKNGNQPQNIQEQIDLAQVCEALKPWCSPLDERGVSLFITACRRVVKDVTADEICDFVAAKGKSARGKDAPLRYLQTTVLNCLMGEPFRQYRQERAQRLEAQRMADQRTEQARAEFEAEEAATRRAEDSWQQLPAEEQRQRRDEALKRIRKDGLVKIDQMTTEQKQRLAEQYAIAGLKAAQNA